MASPHSFWRPLGELLVEHGLLSPRQLELALSEQARTGRKLGEVLVEFGFLSEAALTGTLLEQVGLAQLEPEPEPEPALESEPEPAASYVVKRVEEWHRELLAPEAQRPLVVRMDARDDEERGERRRWWRPPSPRRAPKSELERLVADFEVRSREIRESISEIRRVLGDARSLRSQPER